MQSYRDFEHTFAQFIKGWQKASESKYFWDDVSEFSGFWTTLPIPVLHVCKIGSFFKPGNFFNHPKCKKISELREGNVAKSRIFMNSLEVEFWTIALGHAPCTPLGACTWHHFQFCTNLFWSKHQKVEHEPGSEWRKWLMQINKSTALAWQVCTELQSIHVTYKIWMWFLLYLWFRHYLLVHALYPKWLRIPL